MRPPNILVLMADQLNPKFLPAYGDVVGQTPVIDRLARDGVVFDAAYSNSPLCAPSRYAFLTGQLTSDMGAYDNASELSAHTPRWPRRLDAASYDKLAIFNLLFII